MVPKTSHNFGCGHNGRVHFNLGVVTPGPIHPFPLWLHGSDELTGHPSGPWVWGLGVKIQFNNSLTVQLWKRFEICLCSRFPVLRMIVIIISMFMWANVKWCMQNVLSWITILFAQLINEPTEEIWSLEHGTGKSFQEKAKDHFYEKAKNQKCYGTSIRSFAGWALPTVEIAN